MTDHTTEAERLAEGQLFLIEKRGLYYRPNAAGYTGLKIDAGRYSFDEAVKRVGPNGPEGPQDGLAMWAEDEAPEFSPKCPWDVKIEGTIRSQAAQIATLEAEKERLLEQAFMNRNPNPNEDPVRLAVDFIRSDQMGAEQWRILYEEAAAELAAARDAAVQVKPLEWKKSERGVRFEETTCGSYVIFYPSGGGSVLSWGAVCDTVAEFSGDNLGAKARAAAQADYEKRIMSALRATPAPDPVGEAARVLLGELQRIEPASREQFFAVQAWLQRRLHDALAGEG